MLTEINQDNKARILQLLRSVVVCLDLIRASGNYTKFDISIINNIDALLLDEKYKKLRVEFVSKFDFATTLEFIKRYVMFKVLPEQTKSLMRDLLHTLHRCDQKFLIDLLQLVKSEDTITKQATKNLISGLIHEIDLPSDFSLSSKHTVANESAYGSSYYVGYYGGYTPGYYGGYYGGYTPGYYGGYYGGYTPGYYGGYYGGYTPGYYGGYYGGYTPGYYGGYYGGYTPGYYGGGYYGDGYNGDNYIDAYYPEQIADKLEQDLTILEDEEYLEIFQALRSGIKNNEGQICTLNANALFTKDDGKAILLTMKSCHGDKQQKMFCGIADLAIRDDRFMQKIKLANKK